ncbi:hypothetical protein B0H13DRAFT_2325516 [Mycena leptocephala]|nr:hypothetical protein B0H13DRAFT_2325516 [Mycena leptocephala]
MNPKKWIPRPCAVCGRRTQASLLTLCNPLHYDLSLLRNPSLPAETLPTTYNLKAYDNAILCATALEDPTKKAPFEICHSCKSSLESHQQPPDSLANFHYFGRDELPADIDENNSFSDKKAGEQPDEVQAASQKYSKGNIAIFTQDVATLRRVLPPPKEEIHEAMCALFIGPSTVPTRDNIKTLRPVVVSKTRVQKMLNFLLTRNAFYISAGLKFSAQNLDDIFTADGDEGVPDAVDICCLPDAVLDSESYADRGDTEPITVGTLGQRETIMETVGYTVGERTGQDLREMKASAVAWCLDRNNVLQMQSGSKFLSDRDPGFLTYNFPHLDPWGIGGFHEPNRTESQKIGFERQVRNLLLQTDGAFQKDPNFAYVCWNIIQKADVNRQVNFRTSPSMQASAVSDIQDMSLIITDLMKKWELNPNAKPSNKAEKKAMRTLGKLKLLAKDLKGSAGYKRCRRNEIRALIKKLATPALFLTFNPADIADPLLAAMAGMDPEEWKAMDSARFSLPRIQVLRQYFSMKSYKPSFV